MSTALVPVVHNRDVTHDPDAASKKKRSRKGYVPELLRVTADEVARALAPYVGVASRCEMHALFLRTLWVTGARVSEALAIRECDIDFGSGTIRMMTEKRRGTHYRALPLPASYLGFMARRIAFARPSAEDRIFPWLRTSAHRLIRPLLLAAGVDKRRAHPHAVRHGHAFHALIHGTPITALQAQLGHNWITTTAMYLHCTAADRREAYDRVPW